jgi:hypothetical protein
MVVQLWVIYFWYLEYKSSYTVYCIDFTLIKQELVFQFQMLNDISDCEDIDYVI